jgi:uncharacterized protein YegJ (DUF2314 family)
MGIIVKKLFGALALLIGLGVGGWIIYNLFVPTEEFRRHSNNVGGYFIIVACVVVGWNWLTDQGKGIEQVTPPDLKCAELDEAREKARATMPFALEQAEKNVDGLYVKFPLQTREGLTEHIWGYVHFLKDQRFNVTLANDPMAGEETEPGRRDVPADEVEDWQIMHRDGSIKGAYSLIALFKNYENRGHKLTPRMKKQKALLLDAV